MESKVRSCQILKNSKNVKNHKTLKQKVRKRRHVKLKNNKREDKEEVNNVSDGRRRKRVQDDKPFLSSVK